MSPFARGSGRTLWTAARLIVLLTVLLGLVYPLTVTGVAQVVFPRQAQGSLVHDRHGQVVGSALLGQSFTDPSGAPLRQYFQSRPSAAGDGYDARSSSGSNLGPEDPRLIAEVEQRRAAVAALEQVDPALVPPDALTASGSGLDPHISPAYAELQVARVAAARGLPLAQVRDLVARHTHGPALGYVGQARVDVLALNLALDEAGGRR
ncbi:MAG: potassium-transporting ATPase subunit C [Acidobacteria bacterium]|nr:MAG: potassium-transporting ATPase subunit C [Acidobacteriota bacterium]